MRAVKGKDNNSLESCEDKIALEEENIKKGKKNVLIDREKVN